MTSNPVFVVIATIALIGLSAFFVAVEFAMISARRHRLEERAAASVSARAALRSSTEISLVLAGAQLGITACTLALGSITKPAVQYALEPVFSAWGWPPVLITVAAFVLSLLIVTFLHLVIGEMAPKSWSIAHPEQSAILLAVPMRVFMWLTRPALLVMNNAANVLLHRVGVNAVDELATGQDPEALRELVRHSANVGALDASYSEQLSGALDLGRLQVRDLVRPRTPVTVPADANVGDVQRASQRTGHLRILVGTETEPSGLIHVRDTLAHEQDAPINDLVRPLHELEPDATVLSAVAEMRLGGSQLAVVRDRAGVIGVLTIADMLRGLFPQRSTANA